MSTANQMISKDDERAIRAVLPSLRRSSPEAAAAIQRLLGLIRDDSASVSSRYVTIREVAATYDVTEQTVRNWVDRGWLAGERRWPGGRRRILRSALASADAVARTRPVRRSLTDDELSELVNEP